MRIAMIGTGYVGLGLRCVLCGFRPPCDVCRQGREEDRRLAQGRDPVFEPDLDRLVADNVAGGRLDFATALAAPVAAAEAVFIAVGTPSRRGDGHADLTYVYAAAREIAAALTGFTIVVTKSTVPVGTGDEVERIIKEARPDADVAVVSNPEFCARAPRSRTSSIPTASSSASPTSAPRR